MISNKYIHSNIFAHGWCNSEIWFSNNNTLFYFILFTLARLVRFTPGSPHPTYSAYFSMNAQVKYKIHHSQTKNREKFSASPCRMINTASGSEKFMDIQSVPSATSAQTLDGPFNKYVIGKIALFLTVLPFITSKKKHSKPSSWCLPKTSPLSAFSCAQSLTIITETTKYVLGQMHTKRQLC